MSPLISLFCLSLTFCLRNPFYTSKWYALPIIYTIISMSPFEQAQPLLSIWSTWPPSFTATLWITDLALLHILGDLSSIITIFASPFTSHTFAVFYLVTLMPHPFLPSCLRIFTQLLAVPTMLNLIFFFWDQSLPWLRMLKLLLSSIQTDCLLPMMLWTLSIIWIIAV